MAVQMHYYGSVFDLDPRADDGYWFDVVDEALRLVHEHKRSGDLSVTLVGGVQARIPLFPNVALALLEPREELPGESTYGGSAYWEDGSPMFSLDDE